MVGRAKRRKGQRITLSLGLAWLWLTASPSSAQPAAENAVKAAFLYNFAKFVDWPPESFRDDDHLWICVVGDRGIGHELETLLDRPVRGKRLAIEWPRSQDAARMCHVLFVGASERAHADEVLQQVGGAPVLTVGESPGFVMAGGIINFLEEGPNIRFEINADAADRAGLRLSSRLLKLATRVVSEAAEQ